MEGRSTNRTIALWMNGAYVGSWSLGPNAPDTLQYDTDWVRSEQGRPLSLFLSFMPGNLPHRGPHVRAWFENLLQESMIIRERMTRRYRAGSADAFDLLAEASRDCAGAQEKTALLQIDGRWYRPRGASPITHILKLPLGLIGGMKLDVRDSADGGPRIEAIFQVLDGSMTR